MNKPCSSPEGTRRARSKAQKTDLFLSQSNARSWQIAAARFTQEYWDVTGPPSLASDIWRRVKTNQNERYHLMQRILGTEDAQGLGLPSLCIDFKRYFTIPTEESIFG